MLAPGKTFAKTTHEIAEHMGHKFDDAGEFHMGMVDMVLHPLDKPAPPADPNQAVEFELWKMAHRNYEKQAKVRQRNSLRVYVLIIGQCSQALCNQMEANEEWECIKDKSNVMDILQLIQNCMTQH